MSKKQLSGKQIEQVIKRLKLLNKNTRLSYEKAIDDFLDYFQLNIQDLPAITEEHINRYKIHLRDKYKSSTVNTKLKGISKLFATVKSIDTGFQNPFVILGSSLYVKESTKGKLPYLNQEQVKDLLEYVYTNRPQMHALFKLLCFTGIRISEALSIKKRDIVVNWEGNEKNYYLIINGKGAKERKIRLLDEIYIELENHCKNYHSPGSAYIFYYGRSHISKCVKQFCKELFGRNDISVHTLRHTFATHYYRKFPKKIRELSEMLGHSSYITTKKMYIHVILDEIKKDELKYLYS